MTNLEMLRTATPEQIADMFCDMLCEDFGACSDVCPRSIFERCDEGKNGFVEWLNEEVKTQKDAPKNVPKGWIKLKMEAIGNDIYINTSTIVGLSVRNGASGAFTEIYTIGAEDSPWLVDESIDAVMEKIKNA